LRRLGLDRRIDIYNYIRVRSVLFFFFRKRQGTEQWHVKDWTLDTAHSTIGFSVRHLVTRVHGRFGKWAPTRLHRWTRPRKGVGGIQPWTCRSTSRASTPTSPSAMPTYFLRSADFFDAERFRRSPSRASASRAQRERLRIVGDITIHGNHPTGHFGRRAHGRYTDPWGGTISAGFTATATSTTVGDFRDGPSTRCSNEA